MFFPTFRLAFRLGPVFGGSGPRSRWPHSRCCAGLEAGLGDVGGPTRPKFQEVRANQSITSESDSPIKLVECRLLVVSITTTDLTCMCEWTEHVVTILLSLHQGMYIKSTYDGLHVITGTTEGVSHVNSSFQLRSSDLMIQHYLLFIVSWPLNRSLSHYLLTTDTKRSITSGQFTTLPFLSACCLSEVSS